MNEKSIYSGIGIVLILLSTYFIIRSTYIAEESPVQATILNSLSEFVDIVVVTLLIYLISTSDTKATDYKLFFIVLLIFLLVLEIHFKPVTNRFVWLKYFITVLNLFIRGFLILEFVQESWKPVNTKIFDKFFEYS